MLVIKRKYLLALGLTLLFVSLFFATVPKYLEMKSTVRRLESEFPKLEESYKRYVEQLKAIEEIKKVLKNPPEINPEMFEGVRISKRGEDIVLSGVVDGKEFVKILDYFTKNPNSYVESINLRNRAENPISISNPEKPLADIYMKIRILELKK